MNDVLMSDPKVAAIPVHDCGEPLVDVRLDGSLAVDPRKEDPHECRAIDSSKDRDTGTREG